WGITESLARPSGNVTGIVVDAGSEILAKHLELQREASPQASRVAFLAPRATWEVSPYTIAFRKAAQALGFTLLERPLEGTLDETEYRRVFTQLAQEGAEGLVVFDVPENNSHRALIATLAREARIPVVAPWRLYTEAGALLSYGVDIYDDFRQAAH